jgi:predicted O-methyltransferase YrrM
MNFSIAFKYLIYKLLASHSKGHGIHSPFVFDLVSRVFRNKTDSAIVLNIEKVRKQLLNDKRIINVDDRGSGSKVLKTKFRKVSEIARFSPVPPKYGMLLSNMAEAFGSPGIIELGSSFGISTMYLAAGNRDYIVNTVEGSSSISEIASENFKSTGFENIKLTTGSFEEVLPELLKGKAPGLVFIDGDHRREPLVKYFTMIADKAGPATTVVIDDIHHSEEMEEAWDEIKRFEKVSVTIDIFRMGIAFFREGISHSDYTIRY